MLTIKLIMGKGEGGGGMGGEGRGREGRESLIFLHAHDMLINNGKGGGGRDPEKDEGRGWSPQRGWEGRGEEGRGGRA